MKLSIGMIVKNESIHLRNCLTCLKPILERVDSELIIADTGSTDDTVAIAMEFTKNVLEIPWNDHFAEARNHTIRVAKGEWYMFIDADEYFEDTADLVQFFKRGKYKRFATATVELRNYLSDGVKFNSTHLMRMCKLTKDTKFTGRVHEQLPFTYPTANLRSHIRHLGYTDAAENDLKLQRNFPLVKLAHEENPYELNHISYMAKHYLSAHDFDEAKTYIDKGMALIGRNNKESMFHVFYDLLVSYYIGTNTDGDGYRNAIKTVEKYIKERAHPSYASIRILHQKGYCHFMLSENAAAIEAMKESYALIDAIAAGKLDMFEAISFFGGVESSEYGKWACAQVIAECYAKLDEFDNSFLWLERIPIIDADITATNLIAILASNRLERAKDLFQRVTDLYGEEGKEALADECVARFDRVIQSVQNAAFVVAPFFEKYVKVVYDLLKRTKPDSLSPQGVRLLNSVHQLIYYIHETDEMIKAGNHMGALNNIASAAAADERFGPLLTGRTMLLSAVF